MIIVGIDENGLGPVLGPLIVTGVTIDLPEGCAISRNHFKRLRFRIDDSKKIFNQTAGALKYGEALSLSLVKILTGRTILSAHEFFSFFIKNNCFPCFDGECSHQLCFLHFPSVPVWNKTQEIEEFAMELSQQFNSATIGWLDGAGEVRTKILCPAIINKNKEAGMSKLNLDFRNFIEIASEVLKSRVGKVEVYAGKIGSRKAYGFEISSLLKADVTVVEESSSASIYKIGRNCRMGFVKDADELYPIVSIASIIGKYVREVFMESIRRYAYARGVEFDRSPSGYRDIVTKKFIEKFLSRITDLNTWCFLRRC